MIHVCARRALVLCLIVCIVGPVVDGYSWSRTGHMIIAAMAYRTLPAHLQEAYTDLLRHHPAFEEWEQSYNDLNVDIDFGEYLFMQASFWPDVIRRAGSDYDRPTWHYTNFPLTKSMLVGANTAIGETLTPANDVLHALDESHRILSDPSMNEADRAAHLSWMLHVVGDVHQPLHCVALVNDTYLEGDRGGNLFFVRPSRSSEGVNLHAFWDRLLGTSDDVRNARNETTRLLASGGFEPADRVDLSMNFRDWALEGRALAIEYVYLNGQLEGAVRDGARRAPLLPRSYAGDAKELAEKRAVVAGQRLAKVLEMD